MTKRRKRILFWAGIAIVLAVFGLRVYYVACLPEKKIIKVWVQPDNVHYDEHDPYCLTLLQNGYASRWPLIRPMYYLILSPSNEERGHKGVIVGMDPVIASRWDEWEISWDDNLVRVDMPGWRGQGLVVNP